MDRIRRETIEQYGPAPATPTEALAHVLAVYAAEPDNRLVMEVTSGVYGDGVRTGLTIGDLRALAALIPVATAEPRADKSAHRGPGRPPSELPDWAMDTRRAARAVTDDGQATT
jgi:hypothetical protein